MAEYRSPRHIVAVVASAVALFLGIVLIINPGLAQAANAQCGASEGATACNYYGPNWPRYTPLWFEGAGGNNERHWNVNYAYDEYGGSVNKCAGYKRYDGALWSPLPCNNNGYAVLSIPESWKPGWVYIEQRANGPRSIHGYAVSG